MVTRAVAGKRVHNFVTIYVVTDLGKDTTGMKFTEKQVEYPIDSFSQV